MKIYKQFAIITNHARIIDFVTLQILIFNVLAFLSLTQQLIKKKLLFQI